MVIKNQNESTNNWKYIGSDTGIGNALAWMMKHGNKRDMKCDEDNHVYVPEALQTNKTLTRWRIMTIADDGHQHQL